MKNLFSITLGLCLLPLAFPALALEPVISEFVADNGRTLIDEDSQFADWLEIYNPNAAPFNLAGYHLTDQPGQLTKWTFPSVTLPPGGFLVVFASGKNRTNDPAHLHTSFQLNASGGFLALVKPDGSNIVSSYNYPAVKEDVAFGIAQQVITTSLIATSTPGILVPTNAVALPANWNQLAYTPDLNWTNGVAPPGMGYDTNQGGGLPVNVATTGTAVQSTTYNGSTYPATLAINNIFSDFTHTASADNSAFWQVTLTNEMAIYEVVLFNRGGGCCPWRLRDITVEIVSTNASGSVTNWISPLLNPENALNNPASLSNNLVMLAGGPVLGRTVIVHRKPDPDNSGAGTGTTTDDQNVLSLGEVTVKASLSGGVRPYFNTDLQNLMYNRNASAFVRLPFISINAPDTLALNVRYDDGFVAYLNGTEIARRNTPASPAFDSSSTVDRNLTNATTVESIDLSAGIPLLVSGTNLLAIQLLNYGATNGDALFQPELIATKLVITSNVFLVEVTPGTNNTTDFYYDEVKDTHFSVDRGFFEAPFSLSITSGTPDALIYVSFNAAEPGPGKGFLYTNAFTITNTTVVRTRAFKAGWKATDVDTATYLFLGDVIYQASNWTSSASAPPPYFPSSWGANTVNYGMDPEVVGQYTPAQWREALRQIPSMSVVTEMPNLFDATIGIYANASGHGELWERPASIELLDPTNSVPGRFQENCGLRIRGGFSRNPQFVKHALRVFFRRDYGAGKLNYPLFESEGAQEFETFDLRTSSNYAWSRETAIGTNDTCVREVWCRESLGATGQPYRRSRYYHLYLNGQYWGIYETDERPEASYGESYFGGSKTNFDVVKCGNRSTTPNFITEATDGNLIAYSNLWVMCRAHAANPTASNYFRILGRNPDGTRNPALPVLVDVDNLIDYMLGIFYSGDGDATLSAFLSNNQPNNWFGMRDRANLNAGFRFFNSDCEHTLGANSSQVDRTGPWRDAAGSNIGNFLYANPQYLHEDLMWSAEYRQRFADHVQKHFFNSGAFTFEQCTNRWWKKAGQITKAIRANSARWGDAVREPPYGENNWTNTINWVANTWFPPRAGIVLAQLQADNLFGFVGVPQLSQYGGAVPAGFSLDMLHTNVAGVIYYTTDGTDPRAVGGGVSSGAQAYSGSIPINSQTIIRVRVLTGGVWSGLLEYTFYPPQDLSRLLITEIMYHPPDAGLVDGDEFEFLEFKNASATTLNLSGLRFTSGITFTFTNGTLLGPGQFFVLARNPAQFATVHPGVPVNGIYSGKLDNAGETLTLSHPLGTKVLAVSYDDLAPWPVTPDGFGFSLVPVNPNANPDPDHPANWRASTMPGGSPGADDPVNAIAPILVNEVLSHSETNVDFIELFNPTTNVVNIGGWFLTDAPDLPKKYRIPDGTEIQPLSYVLFDETQFNPTPGTNDSFALGAHGDDVYLFSGDANTNLTGYSHGFTFGASPDGATFGRYVISTGEEQFPLQIEATPGAPNSGPRVGPVVINEIHYHPGAGGDEFIELKNITTNDVPFHDPAHPTNTWKFSGVSFTFPTNIVVGSNQLLLLVATNPASFRAKYSIPVSVQIFGPYAGQLQDSGERLELQRPDVPDTNGFAYITVDEVRYNDRAPWPPAADGSGPSLQRKVAAAYGNDPANWDAALATPGAEFPGGQSPFIIVQPQSQFVFSGSTATLNVSAGGAAPLNFQWRFNGNDVPGATSSNLVLVNAQAVQAGDYSVIVFNSAGSAVSAVAQLTVRRLPSFVQNPMNQFVRPNSNAVFTVNASGNGFLRYQWQFNGVNIASATNFTLVVSNAQFASEGAYTVVVTDNVGPATSAPASLVILVDPFIVQSPLSQQVVTGATVTLSVTVTNTATLPIGYRWRSNTTYIADGFFTLNQRTAFFTLTNVRPPVANWFVVVTNVALPSGKISTAAVFTFVADGDGDGIPDSWETQYFGGGTAANPNDDSDGDGMSNWKEYVAGTDPTNSLSYLKVEWQGTPGSAAVRFGAISNRTYTVQFGDQVSGPWSRLRDVVARPTNRVEVIPDAAWVTNRFYRVVTPQQP